MLFLPAVEFLHVITINLLKCFQQAFIFKVIRRVTYKIACVGRYSDEEICKCKKSASAETYCGNTKICTGEKPVYSTNETKTVRFIDGNSGGVNRTKYGNCTKIS